MKGMMAIGLAEQTFFFRGLLDKLQVKPLPSLRGEYKNVYNFVTHKGYSKAHREASLAWLNSCMNQISGDVARFEQQAGIAACACACLTSTPVRF